MSKQNDIETYINTITGATVTTAALCDACKCTLPTVLTFIKNNPNRFEKVKRGTYTVKAIMLTQTSEVFVENSHNSVHSLPAHEW
jgi:hypothetical protein